MNEIVWIAHGGPGSGRYPKGSGKKYDRSTVTNKGEKLYFKKHNRGLNKDSYYYKIYNSNDKKVAQLFLDKKNKNIMDINYITVKKKYRGNKFAQTILKEVEKIAKETNIKSLTLDATDAGPELHIYKKLGYKTMRKNNIGNLTLTRMKKDIK